MVVLNQKERKASATKRKVGSYGASDVNKAREMVGEGKASNAHQTYAKGGIH